MVFKNRVKIGKDDIMPKSKIYCISNEDFKCFCLRFCGTHFIKSLDPLFGVLSKFSHKKFEMINTYLDCNVFMNCM